MPVYEWNSVLYVATNNPASVMSNFGEWPENWVLVQASEEDLKKTWDSWHHETKTVAIDSPEQLTGTLPPIPAPATAVTTTAATAPAKPAPTPAPQKEGFSADDLFASMGIAEPESSSSSDDANENEDENGESKSEEANDLLEGLLVDAPAPPVSVSSITVTKPQEPASPSAMVPVKDDNTNPPISLEKLNATAAIPGKPPKTKPAIPSGTMSIIAPVEDEEEEASAAPAPIAPPAATKGAKPPPLPAAKPTPPPAAPAQKAVASHPAIHGKTSGKGAAPEFIAVMQEMLKHVPGAYHTLLLATKAGNSIHIASWPENTVLPDFVEYDFSLGTPSPFRIATRTEKPYHGYVVETPFLVQFFKNWNHAKQPELLTVLPMMDDRQVVGYIVAMGAAEGRDRETLVNLEKAAKSVLEKWPKAEAKAS